MKSILFSAFLFISAFSIHTLNATQDQVNTEFLTPRDVFAQRYETLFEEKLSERIWDLGSDTRPSSGCCDFCRGPF